MSTVVERPEANEQIEYVRMLSIRARLRPMRSARKPKNTPPMPEARRVSVYRRPEVAFDMPRSRITDVRTSA